MEVLYKSETVTGSPTETPMSFLYLFTALALGLFVSAVLALAWLVRSGQMDDLETPALRAIGDDAAAGERQPTPEPRA